MAASNPTNSNAAPVAGPGNDAGAFQEDMIWKALKTVRDPEIPVDIVNLGLVYSAAAVLLESGGHRIDVRMSLTAPGCSMSDVIKAEVEQKLAALPDVKEVHVEIVFDPPWNAGMMSEGAKLQLGFDSDYGSAKPGPASSGPFKVIR
ncbi:MAG TPA: iron-sulfur cluster assembly protein [Candidatus Sulfotelmatobacter sp.]|jgi:metal-sulfur cluster biosynthetic enzyme